MRIAYPIQRTLVTVRDKATHWIATLRGERDAPYVFVGREEELDRLTIVAQNTVRQGENLSGVCLVDGIPGIGKTHFLNALQNRLTDVFARVGVRVVRARTNGALLPENNESMFGLLALPAAPPQSVFQKLGKYVGEFSFLAFGAGFNMKQLEGRDFVMRDLAAEFRRTCGEGWWKDTLLLVTVDEVQSARGEAARRALNRLQAGIEGIPMLVVCAGLPNSRKVLGSLDISRRAVNLTLPVLSENEARRGFREGLPIALEERGVGDPALMDRLLPTEAQHEIADDSEHFPRHLMIAIEATADSMVAAENDAALFSVERVRDQVRAERDKYYAERISASGQHSRAFYALAEIMSRQDGAVATEVAEREVGKTARFGPGQSTQDVLEAAVAAGLFVYEEQAEGYLPGIPSVVTYLRRRAEVSGGYSSHGP